MMSKKYIWGMLAVAWRPPNHSAVSPTPVLRKLTLQRVALPGWLLSTFCIKPRRTVRPLYWAAVPVELEDIVGVVRSGIRCRPLVVPVLSMLSNDRSRRAAVVRSCCNPIP